MILILKQMQGALPNKKINNQQASWQCRLFLDNNNNFYWKNKFFFENLHPLIAIEIEDVNKEDCDRRLLSFENKINILISFFRWIM